MLNLVALLLGEGAIGRVVKTAAPASWESNTCKAWKPQLPADAASSRANHNQQSTQLP